MTQFLLATDSVHTTAAACDYLDDRLGDGDVATVVAVREPGDDSRDAGDALNVATARLDSRASVEAETRDGDPAERILEVAGGQSVDEIVLGTRSGAPGTADGLGRTARAVLERATVPVVVVPLPGLG